MHRLLRCSDISDHDNTEQSLPGTHWNVHRNVGGLSHEAHAEPHSLNIFSPGHCRIYQK